MNHIYCITFNSYLVTRYHSARLCANTEYKINPILMNLESKSLGWREEQSVQVVKNVITKNTILVL